MAALDFPNGPSIGDRYPTPAIAGLPQYKWDGEKWTTAAIDTTVALPASAVPLEDNATPQVGVTTKYAREDHVHPSTALKYSAQTLSEAQKVQSRTNLYAAPFDALAYSGLQVNGSMDVSQELSAPAGGTGYVCDVWLAQTNGTMVISRGQYDIPGNAIPGLTKVLVVVVNTAQASLGVANEATVQHRIEGWRIARLGFGTAAARPLTIGFWTGHHRPGTYSVSLRNYPATRACTASYTQNVADAYEYKTVTFPGCTDGTWAKDHTMGLIVDFAFAAGANLIAPVAGVWSTTGYTAAPGQVNAVAATSDIFRITGVVVLPGIEAPSSERSPLIMRPYDQELLACQRYWYATGASAPKGGSLGTCEGLLITSNIVAGTWKTAVTMRAVPTTTLWHNGTQNTCRVTASGAVTGTGGAAVFSVMQNGASAFVTGSALTVNTWLDFDIQFDARL